MSDFRGQITMVRGVDSTKGGFLSRYGVAVRKFICRPAGRFKEFVRRPNAFFRDGSNEAVPAFMGDIAKNLVKWGFGEGVFLGNVFGRICCVTVVNRQAKFVPFDDTRYRPGDNVRVDHSVLRPPLLMANFGAQTIRFNCGQDDANCFNYLKLNATRAARAKKGRRVSARILVLEST